MRHLRYVNVSSTLWGARRSQWWSVAPRRSGKIDSVATDSSTTGGQTGRPVASPRRFEFTLPPALGTAARAAALLGLGLVVAYFAQLLPSRGGRSGSTTLDTGATVLGATKAGAQPAPGAAAAAATNQPRSFGLVTGAGSCATASHGRPLPGLPLALPHAAEASPLAPLSPRVAAQVARASQGLDLQSRAYAAAWELEKHQAGLRPYSPLSDVVGSTRSTRSPLDTGSSPLWGASPVKQTRQSAPSPASGDANFGPLGPDYRWKF